MTINELLVQKELTKYRLARGLDVTMESLLEPYLERHIPFELYKSNVCHQVREQGDINFIIQTLEKDSIRKYYQRGWYPESLYLLAMLDYLSRQNNVPLCTQYDDLRQSKLSGKIFPGSVLAAFAATQDAHIKGQAIQGAIPEFMRFNIVENEVRNVV